MILETLFLMIGLTDLYKIGSYALTSKKMRPEKPLVEDYNLKPEEINRIKNYLQSMHHYSDDQSPRMRDPSSYCRSFRTCYECVKSMWFPCGWCHNYGCTDNPEKLCPYAETVAEKSNLTGEVKACPHIYHDGPITVPAGVRIDLKVKLFAPDPIIYDKEIICQIKVQGKLSHLKGLLLNNVVYCYPVVLNSDATEYGDSDDGTLRLVWGGAQPYSNELPLEVYKCEILGMDCESCKLIPSVYACGWCDHTSKCVIAEKCTEDMMKWALNKLTCEHYGKKLLYI